MIPERCIVVLCGIPAVGKSTYGRALARDHGFVHIDMEQEATNWPDSRLHPIWERSRQEFVRELAQRYKRVALDWGFPPGRVGLVQELAAAGVTVIWLDGDRQVARRVFVQRGGRNITDFDRQVGDIEKAEFPGALHLPYKGIDTLGEDGTFIAPEELVRQVFGEGK